VKSVAPVDAGRVLVIGGAGYIGSALVPRLLEQGFEVVVLDAMHFGAQALAKVARHKNLTVFQSDFRDIGALMRAMEGAGTVIHLGGLVGDPACAISWELTIDINVTSTKIIGAIAKARGVRRFIFASSCSVYGDADEIVDEDSAFNPQSLYARTKVASEAVLTSMASDDFGITCLRFATIYGVSGRTRFDLVLNVLCAKAVCDGLITVFGENQWRPFVHVDDVARAIALASNAPVAAVAGQAFNVGSDEQNLTLGDIARLVKEQVPAAKIITNNDFVDKRNYRVSFAKISRVVGFHPCWSIEDGIDQVVCHIRCGGVNHYSSPEYSNVLHLKQAGAEQYKEFMISGWEKDLINNLGFRQAYKSQMGHLPS
jgi:nucleoside-diphosphate-sugar epimerase